MLQKHYNVKVVDYFATNLKDTFKSIFKIIMGIIWADLSFSWFADSHAYWTVRLSKIFGKKSIVVVGGYEVANLPELNYGLLINPSSREKVKYIFNNADMILPDDEGLKTNAIENLEIKGDNIQTVPIGFDYNKFKPEGEKENMVLTVCIGDTWDRIQLKGVNTFVAASKSLPDVKFIVNGVTGNALKELNKTAPKNVEFIGPVPLDELISLYQRFKGLLPAFVA